MQVQFGFGQPRDQRVNAGAVFLEEVGEGSHDAVYAAASAFARRQVVTTTRFFGRARRRVFPAPPGEARAGALADLDEGSAGVEVGAGDACGVGRITTSACSASSLASERPMMSKLCITCS